MAADTIAHTVCQAVPHRQLVFTIPKRLRLYFRYHRGLLGELARAVWESVVEVYRDVLGRDDRVPGLIAGIQTFGELVHFRPHIHAIATDGGFLPDGTFLCLPRIDTGRLLTAWQTKVFEFRLAAKKIDQPIVEHSVAAGPLLLQRGQQRLFVSLRHGGFATIRPVHPVLSVQPGTSGPPDGRRIGAVTGRTGPLPPPGLIKKGDWLHNMLYLHFSASTIACGACPLF
jgi:hypothetical protein